MKTYKIKAILTHKIYSGDLYYYNNTHAFISANSKKELLRKMALFIEDNTDDNISDVLGHLNGAKTTVRFERILEITTVKIKEFIHNFN